jgi:hypothetical protein
VKEKAEHKREGNKGYRWEERKTLKKGKKERK